MNKLIQIYGEHYGYNLFILGIYYSDRTEKRILNYIDNGLSPVEIKNKLD
jgi:hypothetical protein